MNFTDILHAVKHYLPFDCFSTVSNVITILRRQDWSCGPTPDPTPLNVTEVCVLPHHAIAVTAPDFSTPLYTSYFLGIDQLEGHCLARGGGELSGKACGCW